MKSLTVLCKKCNIPFPPEIYNRNLQVCPACKTESEVYIFPAFFRSQPTHSTLSVTDDEAGCFYHPSKKAVKICDNCGRFLCFLCDIEINTQHLCPSCLEKGKQKQQIKALETGCILYDRIATSLVGIPLLFLILVFPAAITIITAPMAIYISIRYWNYTCSIKGGTKFRFVMSIIISVIQIGVWIVIMYVLVPH